MATDRRNRVLRASLIALAIAGCDPSVSQDERVHRAVVLDSLARLHPCRSLPYRVLFDSRTWSPDGACGVAAVGVGLYLASSIDSHPSLSKVDAVSIQRRRFCEVEGPTDSVGQFTPLRYTVEIDVRDRSRFVTMELDPISLTGEVSEVHRGSWPAMFGELSAPADMLDTIHDRSPCPGVDDGTRAAILQRRRTWPR